MRYSTQVRSVSYLKANAAEVDVVEVPGSIAGNELLAFQCDGTLAGCLKRGVDLAAAGDELVQLERKERFVGGVGDVVGAKQKRLQVGAAGFVIKT